MFLTGGVGMFLSVGVFSRILEANFLVKAGRHDWLAPFTAALVLSLLAFALFAALYRPAKRAPAR